MTRRQANGSPKRPKSQRVGRSNSCGGGRGCCRSHRQNKERLLLPRPGRTRVSEIGGFYEAEHRSDIFWLDHHRGDRNWFVPRYVLSMFLYKVRLEEHIHKRYRKPSNNVAVGLHAEQAILLS